MKANSRFSKLIQWLKNDDALYENMTQADMHQIDKGRLALFIGLHIACLGVLFVGFSWYALLFAGLLYFIRMFAITAFYHRYFSHKTYKVSRVTQFFMALLGCSAGQRGPIWWSGHHRQHHLTSDTEQDPHSPKHGFLNSHTLWFLRRTNFATPTKRAQDWLKFPELVWLDRYDWLPFIGLAIICFAIGHLFSIYAPNSGVTGWQFLVWGFFVSTIVLYHATYTINSLAHQFGRRRYDIADNSRNNALLAFITLGEGWHNNHHRYPAAAKQGFYWWELDISYLLIRLMSLFGLVYDIRPVPVKVLAEGRKV